MRERDTLLPADERSCLRAVDVHLAHEAARILRVEAPLPGGLESWLCARFTQRTALILWSAARDLARRGDLADAYAVIRDACYAQSDDGETGEPTRIQLDLDLNAVAWKHPGIRSVSVEHPQDVVAVQPAARDVRRVSAA